jgi:hypothetical protein
MDDDRPFTAAEWSFFSECGTGSGEFEGYFILIYEVYSVQYQS